MQRIKLSEEVDISRIVQGYMRLIDWNVSDSDLDRFIRHGLDCGITTVDHADIYGGYTAEERFGRVLKQQSGLRDQLQIITKCGIVHTTFPYRKVDIKHYDYSYQHIVESVNRSLTAFGSDSIDVLLLHRPSPQWVGEEIAKAFDDLYTSGKVKAFGVSNFLRHHIEFVGNHVNVPLVMNQLEISPVETGYFRDGTIDYCQMNGLASMAWSPIGGLPKRNSDQQQRVLEALHELAPKYNCDWSVLAVAWLLNHPADILPLIGTGNPERVSALSNVSNIKLDMDDWYRIYTASTGKSVP